jgi:DHA2 family multidrug resistance protein
MDRLLQNMTERYGVIPGAIDAGHAAALKKLWELAYREASTLAYADAFHVIMLAFIVATLMVPLMRSVVPPKVPAAEAH